MARLSWKYTGGQSGEVTVQRETDRETDRERQSKREGKKEHKINIKTADSAS